MTASQRIRLRVFALARRVLAPLARVSVRYVPALPGRVWLTEHVVLPSLRAHPRVFESRTRAGFFVAGNTADVVLRYLYVFGVWEPNVSRLMRDRLMVGDVVIDVGANIGYHSMLASRLVGERGSVLAFEPSPSIRKMLVSNLHRNKIDNVQVVGVAASDVHGCAPLFRGPESNLGLTSLMPSGDERRSGDVEAEVETAPLSDLLADVDLSKVRLVKIDVEGAEEKVIRGAVKVFDDLPAGALVLVEVDPRRRLVTEGTSMVQSIVELMESLGYETFTLDNRYDPPLVAKRPNGKVALRPLDDASTIADETEIVFRKRRLEPLKPERLLAEHRAAEEEPVISVVLAVRNEAATIEQQLAALEAQDLQDPWELVIADNGSSDETVAIASRWAERFSRFRIVDASARLGCGAAKNQGVCAATSSRLAFCDGDDVVSPGWLEALSSALEIAPLVAGASVVFQGDVPASPVTGPDRPPRHLGWLPFAEGCNLAIRRDVFDSLGGFDERFTYTQDVELSWRAQLKGHQLGFARGAFVWKRDRRNLRSLARQFYEYGQDDALLQERFQPAGLPRSHATDALKSWVGVAIRLPTAFSPRRRRALVVTAAQRAGRLRGSLHEGVICL